MVRTKVFVGNLSFKTREAELAQEFAAAGAVIGANIITRGPRSLGYGFVEFDNEEDANNAVRLMSKKEIDGRQINVEVAKPREELEQQQQANGESPSRGGRGRGGFRGGRGRGGRGRGRGGFGARRGGAPGGYRRRFGDDQEGGEEQQPQEGQERRPRRPRARRFGGNQEQEPRTESKTTLFVANLPFALDDESFAKVFNDNGLKFKTAHVVKKRNGRSKGFGFAEFDAQEDQQKALQALNGKKVEERELIVKIALTEQQPRTDDNTNKKQEETTGAETKKEETK